MGDTKRFAFHVNAQRRMGIARTQLNHFCGVLEAASEDEAIGKAMRIAKVVYRAENGWTQHFVGVDSADFVVTPENAVNRVGASVSEAENL